MLSCQSARALRISSSKACTWRGGSKGSSAPWQARILLDLAGLRRLLRVESAMEADHAVDIGAAAREFEHRGAAEAVADRGGAGGVDHRLALELRQGGGDSRAQLM